MKRLFSFLAIAVSVALAQYKMEPSQPPPELAPGFSSAVSPQGSKILAASGSVYAELWFRPTAPSGPKSSEESVALPTIPHGTILGVIRFPANGADRRGQQIKPGVYTMRYSLYPVNGDHLGVAPQRDFVCLTPIAEDKDPAATPDYETLMNMSRKASGTPHPAVLSISSSSSAEFPKFEKEGENDWVLHIKMGEIPASIIVIGKAES